LLFLSCCVAAQFLPPVSAAKDYAHVTKNVVPERLLSATSPVYTAQARDAGIEGSVVLQVVISPKGRVTNASVLSPLPCGLDAQALAAVPNWKFEPATMDGELIPLITTLDVRFRLPYTSANHELRQQRLLLRQMEAVPTPVEVEQVKGMAGRGVVGAVELLGEWRVRGTAVPKDVGGGLAAIRFAADHNDARALNFLGQAELTGNQARAWDLLRRAAYFGSAEAQRSIAAKDEASGDRNGAKWYFRMCAATAHPACERQLGQLLVTGPGVNPNDFTQGVAWLELAKEHGDAPAAALYRQAAAKLSSLQVDWVRDLKPHLELREYSGF
jgi:TonB family protein